MPVYAYGLLIYPLFYQSGHRTFGTEDPIDQGQVCGGPGGHNSPSGGGNQAGPDHDALRTAFIISQGLEGSNRWLSVRHGHAFATWKNTSPSSMVSRARARLKLGA